MAGLFEALASCEARGQAWSVNMGLYLEKQNFIVYNGLFHVSRKYIRVALNMVSVQAQESEETKSFKSQDALLGFKNELIDLKGLLAQWVLVGTNCCNWLFVYYRQFDGVVFALNILGSILSNQQPYCNSNRSSSSSNLTNQLGSKLANLIQLEVLKLQAMFFNNHIFSSLGFIL